MYIDIFLTVTQKESLLLNLIVFSAFSYFAFSSPSTFYYLFMLIVLTLSSKITILTLAIFALKFSIDGKSIKDQLFVTFAE